MNKHRANIFLLTGGIVVIISDIQISQLPLPFPDLSANVIMKDGQVVDVSGDKWVMTISADLPTPMTIDWTLLRDIVANSTSCPVMSSRAVSQVQAYSIEMLTKNKPGTVRKILRVMLDFARWLAIHPEWLPVGHKFNWSELSEDMFYAWVTAEYQTSRKGDSATIVRCFYRWGANLDQPCSDFSAQLSAILTGLKLQVHAIGELVASRDCRRGAFSREELEMILAACRTGKGSDHDRALTWILFETAARPEQIYRLRNCDLLVIEKSGEEETGGISCPHIEYSLRIRIIKLRSVEEQYQYISISSECGRLLQAIRRAESTPDERLFWWLPKRFHAGIDRGLKVFFKAADLRSPRLPIESPSPEGPCFEIMPVHARRFRYGIATDRIARGDSPENVGNLLGHKDTESVGIYADTSPLIADEFQRTTDYAIRPLIQRMQGRVDDSINITSAYLKSEISLRVSSDQQGQYTRISERMSSVQGQSQLVLTPNAQSAQAFTHNAASAKSRARIDEMVSIARRKFPQLYPGQNFDAQLWEIRHLMERPYVGGNNNLIFTMLDLKGHRPLRDPVNALPPHFSEVLKSWIVLHSNVSVSFNISRLYGARYLWKFLITEQPERALCFEWGSLTESDLLAIEYFLRNRCTTPKGRLLSPSSIRLIMSRIQALVDFLTSRGICRRINYAIQTASTREASTRQIEAKQRAAEEKLPSPGVLEALADIYYRVTTAPTGTISDRVLILISGVAILMLTGIRIGELVTMPFDCEIDEQVSSADGSPASRYGLKYWVEKTRRKTPRIKWISPTAEPIVRAAITRIKRLTAEARERAKVLEHHPTRVPLPTQFTGLTTITMQQLGTLLGRRWTVPPRGVKSTHGRCFKQYGKSYLISDVEEYLLARRVRQLYTVSHGDGTVQKLSESLFISFVNQASFHKTDICKLLVEPIKAERIGAFLSAPRGQKRTHAFSEFGLTAEERALTINPHSFRHWLIHIAYKGGMELYSILRYFARQDNRDTLDYLHYITEETGAYVSDEMRMIYPTN